MRINQLKAGVILSYLSMILGSVISIAYTPIMLRLLGQSEYGIYTVVSSVVSYLGLLSFGFGSSYVRFYSRYKVNEDRAGIASLNGMFMTVYFVIFAISMVAGLILSSYTGVIFQAKFSNSEIATAKILMVLLTINISLSFPLSLFTSYITANERYLFQRVLNLIKSVANPFLTLPVLLMGYKSVGLVVSMVTLNLTIEFINAVYCFKKLHMQFRFTGLKLTMLREIAIFSSFIFINIVVDQINWNIDKFLLGMFQGTLVTAVYGLASQLNTYYMTLSSSVSSVFIPRVHAMVARNDMAGVMDLFTRVGRIQFYILALIASGFIFFGHPFLLLWGGSEYGGSYPIALLLIIPAIIPLIQNLGIEIQRAQNLHKFRSLVYLGIAVGNALISIPLCQAYGGVGCAAGTAAAILIGNGIVMNVYYHKRCHMDMLRFWQQILRILPALIIPCLSGLAMQLFVDLNHVVSLLLCMVIYTFIFCVCVWLMAMNTSEKDLIRRPLKKLFRLEGSKNV